MINYSGNADHCGDRKRQVAVHSRRRRLEELVGQHQAEMDRRDQDSGESDHIGAEGQVQVIGQRLDKGVENGEDDGDVGAVVPGQVGTISPAWELSTTPEKSFCLETLRRAL
jgi:hypothetical protein